MQGVWSWTYPRANYTRMSAAASVDKPKYCGAFPDFEIITWLVPLLVSTDGSIEYTPGGGLRQLVFKGLWDDKSPGECIIVDSQKRLCALTAAVLRYAPQETIAYI